MPRTLFPVYLLSRFLISFSFSLRFLFSVSEFSSKESISSSTLTTTKQNISGDFRFLCCSRFFSSVSLLVLLATRLVFLALFVTLAFPVPNSFLLFFCIVHFLLFVSVLRRFARDLRFLYMLF